MICEVEVDLDTGAITVDRLSSVDDVGLVVNPLTLEGQVHGSVAHSLGEALLEEMVYERGSGQLLTGSFMDYALPRADVVPHIHFDMHNVECKTNPLGLKGAGEAGAIGAPPAVINAIVDALHPHTGLKHIDMPATSQAVWQAIQRSGRRAAA